MKRHLKSFLFLKEQIKGIIIIIKWLSEQDGVSLTARDLMGRQPIHRACSGAHLELVKWLLEHAGADM
jgi:hypothetical protein